MKNILLIIFILTSSVVISQTATTFLFAKTIDHKTNKSVGLVDIVVYRNDSAFIFATTDLSGESKIKKEYKFYKNNKYKLVVSAIGYQRQCVNLDTTITFPIVIKLTKKNGENLKIKDSEFVTHCFEPSIKDSEKIRDSIIVK